MIAICQILNDFLAIVCKKEIEIIYLVFKVCCNGSIDAVISMYGSLRIYGSKGQGIALDSISATRNSEPCTLYYTEG